MKTWIKTTGTAMAGLFLLSSAAIAENSRNVELILDASGSMNGKIAGGVRKIDAAKEAVNAFVDQLPSGINLSFRAYGHQHHRREHVCNDTQLMVPFGKAGDVAGTVKSQSAGLKAQGYTPITYVLGLAADDLKPLEGDKTIVLVSDGKETCEGDPCLLAQKLAAANADLVIHTIGFGVDAQTRGQLQCIARVGRGTYYDANNADDLTLSMQEATVAEAPAVEEETITITIKKNVPGTLVVENNSFHRVFDAETGEAVKSIAGGSNGSVELPAGIYNVQFGDDLLWKSVQVVSGETTTLRAGVLAINNSQFHKVLDPETGHKYVSYNNADKAIPLPPGRYDVTFGDAIWHNIELKEGEKTVLDPAILKIPNPAFHQVLDARSGEKVLAYNKATKWLSLPPGKYDVTFDKTVWEGFELKAGEETIVEPATLIINNNQSHPIRDAETGKQVIYYNSGDKRELLPPGSYDVMFSKVPWRIEVKKGEKKTLNPGGIAIEPRVFTKVRTPDGKLATNINTGAKRAMLPPGDYLVEVADQEVPVKLTEGKIVTIKIE